MSEATAPLPPADLGLAQDQSLGSGANRAGPVCTGGGREGAAPAGAVFAIGDAVEKVGGDYAFPGEVRARLGKRSGQVRYVVEDDRGALHIFRPEQLRHALGEPTAPPVPDWVGDFINRRTDVEGELRDIGAGKRPLPTAEDCRRMADTLSIPSIDLRRYPPLAARPEPKEWR